MKNIAMIIAFQDFRDEEYLIPKSIFVSQGFKVKTFSSEAGEALGTYGGVVEIDDVINNLEVKTFDAVLFIGGSGAMKYEDNKEAHRILKESLKADKVIGAICIAPVILARAGILKGKKATVWSSNMDKTGIKILEEEGSLYTGEDVTVDDKIVTANGPKVARDFGEAIIRLI